MLFSEFIVRIESANLFHRAYEDVWVHMDYVPGNTFRDSYSMYHMGGEL